jgi:hypothetical protein
MAFIPERRRSAGGNGASDLDFRENSERHFRSVASLGSSGFGGGIVLVLSIAVLVLVLDSIFRYSVHSLNQSSEHRYNPFQVGFTTAIRIIVDRVANLQDIMNCSTFQGRPASDFKESILVLETLLAIALGNV